MDDAARAVVMYCTLWRQHRIASARSAADGLLRFLAHMQDDDGRMTNFIVDWDGHPNTTGSTSYPGGPQWQARALHAFACASAAFGGDEWNERFERALPWVDEASPYLDVRAVAVLAVLQHWQATRSDASAQRAIAWCDEIASQRRGDRLLNAAGVEEVHLWGHLQEAALADAGRLLDRPSLVECAVASAEALLLPAAERGFDFNPVLPFDVSCATLGLQAVARATGDRRYVEGAARARMWFLGRNAARKPVYDRQRGLVYDGIDGGRVSRNSGAESNVEGALAMLGSLSHADPELVRARAPLAG